MSSNSGKRGIPAPSIYYDPEYDYTEQDKILFFEEFQSKGLVILKDGQLRGIGSCAPICKSCGFWGYGLHQIVHHLFLSREDNCWSVNYCKKCGLGICNYRVIENGFVRMLDYCSVCEK
jgi:hypothetical protein